MDGCVQAPRMREEQAKFGGGLRRRYSAAGEKGERQKRSGLLQDERLAVLGWALPSRLRLRLRPGPSSPTWADPGIGRDRRQVTVVTPGLAQRSEAITTTTPLLRVAGLYVMYVCAGSCLNVRVCVCVCKKSLT